ncbi:MAG TPA: SLC13 family permease, partial [Anaerolineales bacterium]|nr:SLC13 family permease [Anaerolineales bacterium]
MTTEIWLTFAILLAAIVLFVTEWIRLDITALGVVAALMLTGILTPEEAVAGFANPAVITIAALFVVGGAVLQTGLASLIGQRILQVAGGSLARLTGVIMGAVGGLSGFMSSTGAVAVLLPAIVSLAGSVGVSASKLLIPLAYGSLLGGLTTQIGTPPNILVS